MKQEDRSLSGPDSGLRDAGTIIDREHLSQFAMGDHALEHRFLGLFVEHAQAVLKLMQETASHEMSALVHSLKSSASSVGAWRIVAYAQETMDQADELLADAKHEAVAEFARLIEEAVAHARQITGQ